MGHRGGSAPNGLSEHVLKTLFLRAPYGDFAAIAQGAKREFRGARLGVVAPRCPTPVVLYAVSKSGHLRHTMMVLISYHEQLLMDIADSPPSLAREGFANYKAFRAYWRKRTRKPWNPTIEVAAFHLAPWSEEVADEMGRQLLRRLYGDHLPHL